MKHVTVLLVALIFGTQANASTYRCTVENHDGYAVEVNMNTNLAAFGDNNEWIVASRDEIGDNSAAYFSTKEGEFVSIKIDLSEWSSQALESHVNFIEGGDDIITRSKLDCTYASELASGI